MAGTPEEDARMSYEVIARRWRPKAFETVVGQRHVTETLKNAIASDRLAHAGLQLGSLPLALGAHLSRRVPDARRTVALITAIGAGTIWLVSIAGEERRMRAAESAAIFAKAGISRLNICSAHSRSPSV